MTPAPDQKEAPSVTSEPKSAPPSPSKATSKPSSRPGAKAPHFVPLIATGAVIVIAAGAIGIFRPQLKEWLVTAGVLAGKPATPIEQPSPPNPMPGGAPGEASTAAPAPAVPTPAAPNQSAEQTAPQSTTPGSTTPESSTSPAQAEAPNPSETALGTTAPTGGTPGTASEAKSSVARLEADEARIDRLQTTADAVGKLQQRLAALEGKPAADPASVQAVTAGLADAVGRIARLEAQIQQQATAQRNEKAMILALAELKDRLAGSGPFDGPVAVLKAAAGDDPAFAPSLGVLDKFAARGVAGRTILAERLDTLPAALNAPAAPPSDAGLWQRIEARAQKLVTIRRVDDGSGGSLPPGPERTIATAAAALKAGDLAGAVEAVRSLDGQAAEVAKPWLDQAQDRQAVEQAADRLMAAATQRLQAAGQDKAP